jgi:alpha-galactosidase
MIRLAAALLVTAIPFAVRAGDPPKSLKVFILAGQSNMEGKAKVSVLEYQAKQSAQRAMYQYLLKGGKWVERDDVWIKYREAKGKLTVGYGNPRSFGPELGFGAVVGDHYAEQVLLIKTAWGGRSLYRDFRSPSAGWPAPGALEKALADQRKKKPDTTLDDVKKPFGASYRDMMDEVEKTLANLKALFPDYQGQRPEIAGFIWFQGWNDMINPDYTAEYTTNLAHFIRDIRRDLKAPKLPFVIGVMGVDGDKASGNVKKFKDAQAAVMAMPDFKDNVALVQTDRYWDWEADAVFRKGWRENLDAWNRVGSDFPYHYLGSPKTMLQIGRAFGDAALVLCVKKTTNEN